MSGTPSPSGDFKKAFREGQERLLNGSYLPPEEYLDASYILQHTNTFNNRASYLMTFKQYTDFVKGKKIIGRADGQFVTTKEKIDAILYKANGDIAIIEKELGIPDGDWTMQGGVVRIDVNNIDDLDPHIPYGNESGANEFWHPGGYTSGGAKELVVKQFSDEYFEFNHVIK
ncbi:MAG: hypothetical protein MI866_10650 [Bacteroidales bacterium]|nr:hypothetical protein [Bacteroidales bacterium]